MAVDRPPRTGIYILLGDDPETLGGTLAYIGEGDDVSQRLAQLARSEGQGGRLKGQNQYLERTVALPARPTGRREAW
jgi:hypothetical protein